MSDAAKDSAEVMTFMTLFAQVKKVCCDQPEALEGLAKSDRDVQDLCMSLRSAMDTLDAAEDSQSRTFAAPVGRDFKSAWRDCQDRYLEPLFLIMLAVHAESREGKVHVPFELWNQMSPDAAFVAANAIASQAFIDLSKSMLALRAFKDQIHNGWEHWQADKPEPLELDIDMALRSWDLLADTVGLDIQTAIRRKRMLPFTLVPQEVQLLESGNARLSLLRLLEDAQRAFVFGSTLSAVGLMRSTLESVLRDHYNPWDSKLVDLIDNATGLPAHIHPARLHTLRRMANAILHPSPSTGAGLVDLREEKLEKEMISLFRILRDLIEGIPEASK